MADFNAPFILLYHVAHDGIWLLCTSFVLLTGHPRPGTKRTYPPSVSLLLRSFDRCHISRLTMQHHMFLT